MLMIFFIMPGVMSGLGNLLLPVQLGVPELVQHLRSEDSIYVARTAAAALLC